MKKMKQMEAHGGRAACAVEGKREKKAGGTEARPTIEGSKRREDETADGDGTYVRGGMMNGVSEEKKKVPNVFSRLTFDRAFKIVLGTEGRSEDVLKAMLNSVLNLGVETIELLPTGKSGMTVDDNESAFDVYCRDSVGRRFLIEMQMWRQKNFKKRSVFYSSYVVQDQAAAEKRKQRKRKVEEKPMPEDGRRRGRSHWDYDYDESYAIGFLNFKNDLGEDDCEKSANPYATHYIYKSMYSNKPLRDGTNQIFIDLDKFCKASLEDCVDDVERWLYSIKYMHLLEEIPKAICGTELEGLYEAAMMAQWPSEVRRKFEIDMANENDRLNSMYEQIEEAREEALKEGRKEGMAEGRAEGRAEAAMEIARGMLRMGADTGFVAQATGLDEDIVKGL